MSTTVSSVLERELVFLKKKLSGVFIAWEERPLIDQIISPKQSGAESDRLFERLKSALQPKAKEVFPDIVKIVAVRSDNTTRVIIHVGKLRQIFADEIDGWSGGGGRKLKNIQLPSFTRR